MAVTSTSRTDPRTEPRTEKGISLSRGPALILGTLLLAAGLYYIYKQHTFPKFSNFPSGTAHVDGKVIFGLFGGNGWTGMLSAVAGGLLLFGAAQHHLAKTMSLIVGVVLGVAAVLGFVNHGNVLGLPSANHLTELAWAIAAVILLLNVFVPRRTRTIEPVYDSRTAGRGTRRRHTAEAAAAGAGAGALAEHEHEKHREQRQAGRGGVDRAEGGRTAADQPRAERSEDATAVQDRGAGEGAAQPRDPQGGEAERGAGGDPQAGADRGAGDADRSATRTPNGDSGAADQREPVGTARGSAGGDEDPGLAERTKRLFRPGSGS
jgi:hypothetical protein